MGHTSDTGGTVHERMARVVADLDYIPKGRARGVSYEFRGIDSVMNHLHPLLARHGLYLSPRVMEDWQVNQIPGTNNRMQSQALFRVCVDVYAADGSMVTLGPGMAQSHDYGDKAVYQAQQNAVKYVLLEAFCIPTQDSGDDMDTRQADPIPAKPTPADRLGVELAKLCAGDVEAARVLAVAAAKALNLSGAWASSETNVDAAIAWAQAQPSEVEGQESLL